VGYRKIENLYKHPNFLQCYALEKCDGSSANIKYHNNSLTFFSGGGNHTLFVNLFDETSLLEKFKAFSQSITPEDSEPRTITVFGEAFGGKIQGMSHIYGPSMRFVAFEVQIGERWYNVPYAEEIVRNLGLEFVPYEKGPLEINWLNEQRDRPSLLAVVPNAPREGIVIRQVYEDQLVNGGRHIYKHKRPECRETKSVREVDPEYAQVLSKANEIAEEYVVAERLKHVLQKTPYNSPEDTGKVLRAMVEDIKVEAEGEIVWSKEVRLAITKRTAQLLHNPENYG
jgi:hypothetical protein